MKVIRKSDNKEVKDAKVQYFATGAPAHVIIDGVNHDPSAFDLQDDEPKKKTAAKTDSKKTKKADKKLDNVLSTDDVK